ncbi:MAG: hypothetical protein ACI9MC_004165 [Kiritimatiellia bacterium]|jgi:hypothetical protein
MAAEPSTSHRWPWLYPVQLGLWIIAIFTGALLLILLVQVELLGEWHLARGGTVLPVQSLAHVGVLDANLRRIYTDSEAEVVLSTWEDFLGGLEVTHQRVGGLDEEAIAVADVLLVPTVHGLTPVEREQLAVAVEGGVSVLIGASAPLHDDEALDLRSAYWRHWLGVSARDVETLRQERFLRPPLDSPFDSTWTPGDGVRFRPGMRVIRMGNESEVSGAEQHLLPIHHGEQGQGRWVHLGFDPTTVPTGDDTLHNVSSLLVSALSWLEREPTHEVGHWPAGKRNALLISGLVEGDDVVPREISTALERRDIGVTWYFESERDPAAPMPPYGEVAVWGVHPGANDQDDRALYSAVALSTQSVRKLARSQHPVGYSPRTYGMGEAELQGAAMAQLDYVFASSLQRGDQPEVRKVRPPGWFSWARSMVLLPRSLPDDIAITIEQADGSPVAIFGWYERELARRADQQSLQQITVRSRTLNQVGAGAAFKQMLDALPSEQTWTPTAAELASWWRQRDGVRVVVEPDVAHRLLVRVSNIGSETVRDLEVTIHLPDRAREADARLVHWRRTLATDYTLLHEPGTSEARLHMANVPPGANEALFVSWE